MSDIDHPRAGAADPPAPPRPLTDAEADYVLEAFDSAPRDAQRRIVLGLLGENRRLRRLLAEAAREAREGGGPPRRKDEG